MFISDYGLLKTLFGHDESEQGSSNLDGLLRKVKSIIESVRPISFL